MVNNTTVISSKFQQGFQRKVLTKSKAKFSSKVKAKYFQGSQIYIRAYCEILLLYCEITGLTQGDSEGDSLAFRARAPRVQCTDVHVAPRATPVHAI